MPVANARANNQRGISVRTLKGWVAAYRAAGSPNERLAALAPRPTKKETPVVQIAWLADFMAYHCRPSAPKLAHSYQEFAKGWLAAQPAYGLPSLDTVRRVWKKLPQIMQQRGRMTGAAYKSLLPYIRRDWQALRPNDVWIGDGHSFKAKVQHPIHGQPFKPEVTVIIDGCTRMVVGFSFSLAESCVAVADALRIGIKHNGVPLMYYSDNGGGQKRAKGRIKRAENTIRLAKEETRPAIEHQPDFGLLVGNGNYEPVPAKKPQIFMFESDRDEWERQQAK